MQIGWLCVRMLGDRVAVCPMGANDGRTPGYATDGGYATYTTAAPESLVRIPDHVDFKQGAAATDAGGMAYHAVITKGQVRKGTKVGIIGVGGLGTVGMRVAIAKGADVYVATRNAKAQEKARKDGAHKVASNIKDFAGEQLDVIVDFAGAGVTTADALNVVKFGGKVVLVGMAKLETTINTTPMITMEKELIGSVGSNTQEVKAASSGWSLGASLNLRTAFRAGLSGMVLLLFFYLLLTPLLLLFEKKVLKSDGVTAIALNSVPGLAISFPLMFGKVFPRLTPHMEVAAAQVAFAVILSSILTPIFARYISGSQRTRT